MRRTHTLPNNRVSMEKIIKYKIQMVAKQGITGGRKWFLLLLLREAVKCLMARWGRKGCVRDARGKKRRTTISRAYRQHVVHATLCCCSCCCCCCRNRMRQEAEECALQMRSHWNSFSDQFWHGSLLLASILADYLRPRAKLVSGAATQLTTIP